eukprot:1006608-Karenia_brevis.AAC.1
MAMPSPPRPFSDWINTVPMRRVQVARIPPTVTIPSDGGQVKTGTVGGVTTMAVLLTTCSAGNA